VYRSNVVKGHLNPKWEATMLQLEAVCHGDLNRPVKIVVKDYRSRFGKHLIMGEVEISTWRWHLRCAGTMRMSATS
jgi:C2 domain